MYSIGQFSLITNTTKKALRHYDEIGLLKPSRTEGNSYRYYDESKIAQIRQINELKSYGLPLAMITQLMGDGETYSIEDILSVQLQKLSQEIEALNRKKDNIMVRLNGGGAVTGESPSYPVDLVRFEDAPVIAAGFQTDMEHMGEAIGQFYEFISARQLSIRGDVMISRLSEEDSDVFRLQVFAYSDCGDCGENRPFAEVGGLYCLHCAYRGFKNREEAYIRAFAYAREQGLSLGEKIVEKYTLVKGAMSTDFYIEIIG